MSVSGDVTWPLALGRDERPWRRGLLWLLFLGPFFFVSYGFANGWAAQRGVTTSVVFEWEAGIPFVPWTIVPYWSIDLLYGLSFLLCHTRQAVDRHAARLLTAQLISVACFLALPLRFGFARPDTDGVLGWLFDTLSGFDQPYNQAPSLHISLLVIIWARFALASRGVWRLLVHGWALLIGVSVLTTYQHHFLDVPTGALVGALCLWLWPDTGAVPLAARGPVREGAPRSLRLAAAYWFGSAALAALASALGGAAWWLLWGATALGLVGLGYACMGVAVFQKRDGRLSAGAMMLLAPYLAGAWLNSRWWTRRHPVPVAVVDGIFLGRLPSGAVMRAGGFTGLCDLTAELPAPQGPWRYAGHPTLDLLPPAPERLYAAARDIEALRHRGPVLVCCALGYSRSACAIAAWLLLTGRAADPATAAAQLRARQPAVVLGAAHLAALDACQRLAAHDTSAP